MADNARKDDKGKPDLTLIPYSALKAEAQGFMFGADKYGRYNFLKGNIEMTRLLAAALRHIYAKISGEQLDPESGVHHLGHARCCLAMAIELEERGKVIDNRPPTQTSYLADGTEIHFGSGLSAISASYDESIKEWVYENGSPVNGPK